MNSRCSKILVLVFSCLPAFPMALPDPDFSGTWVMDKDRSFSNPAGLEQTMIIVHRGDRLEFDARLKTAQGEQQVKESWILDDRERETIPEGAPPGTSAKRKAYWLPGRRAVVLVDDRTSNSPSGPMSQKTTRKLTLSSDSGTLTIDYYFDNARGSYEAKRVFVNIIR